MTSFGKLVRMEMASLTPAERIQYLGKPGNVLNTNVMMIGNLHGIDLLETDVPDYVREFLDSPASAKITK